MSFGWPSDGCELTGFWDELWFVELKNQKEKKNVKEQYDMKKKVLYEHFKLMF